MPGKPLLEDLVTLLQPDTNPAEIVRHGDVLAGGSTDLRDRLQHIEHLQLETAERMTRLEAAHADFVAGFEKVKADRDDYGARVTAVEKLPNESKTRLDALEPRVRALEGAVGSVNLAKTRAKAKPDAAPDAPAETNWLGQKK